MSGAEKDLALHGDDLFARVAAILEAARGNVVRAVNSNMVLAYFLIGREIVETVQEGEETAEYGKGVLRRLSEQLTARFGTGYSERNLRHFRQFYQTFEGRIEIRNPSGSISLLQPSTEIRNPSGSTFIAREESPTPLNSSFAPELTWSHYRALSRVSDPKARDFYESEAIECGWSKAQLERQIQSSLYQRILANRGEAGLVSKERERLAGEAITPRDILRSPLVLEFLELPDAPTLHESKLEQAIIENLQSFMLELGKGFAFVARQKHIRFEDDDFYIDLVFYNYLLKCFLLVDLKIGKVSHQDVGQMDGYVRLFEDRFKVEGDNPTIGLIVCSDTSEAVAKYSVLSEGEKIFAAKYLQFLPTEQELKLEMERERRLLEARKLDDNA